MQRFPRRWTEKDCIEFLQRKIILNSIAYYEFDRNFLTDKYYDSISRQLVDMQANYKGNVEADTMYGYMMYDFDGSTGFDLPGRLSPQDKEYLYGITQHFIGKQAGILKKKEVSGTKKRRLF